MIKAYLNLTGDDEDKYVYEIEGSGNMNDVIAEIELLIGSMFTTIREKNTEAGDLFRAQLVAALLVPGSPVWEIPGGLCELNIKPKQGEGSADA